MSRDSKESADTSPIAIPEKIPTHVKTSRNLKMIFSEDQKIIKTERRTSKSSNPYSLSKYQISPIKEITSFSKKKSKKNFFIKNQDHILISTRSINTRQQTNQTQPNELPLESISTQNMLNTFRSLSIQLPLLRNPETENSILNHQKKFWQEIISSQQVCDLLRLTQTEPSAPLKLQFKDLGQNQANMTKNELKQELRRSEVYIGMTSEITEPGMGTKDLENEIVSFFRMTGDQAKKKYIELLSKGKGEEIFQEIVKGLLKKKILEKKNVVKSKKDEKEEKIGSEILESARSMQFQILDFKRKNENFENISKELKENFRDFFEGLSREKRLYETKLSEKAAMLAFKSASDLKIKNFPFIKENIRKVTNYREEEAQRRKNLRRTQIFRRIKAKIRSRRIKKKIHIRKADQNVKTMEKGLKRWVVKRRGEKEEEERIVLETWLYHFEMMNFAAKLRHFMRMRKKKII